MSSIYTQFVNDLDLSILTINEIVSVDHLDNFITRSEVDRSTRNLIVYVGKGVATNIGVDELKALIESRLEVSRERRGGHTVFVLEDEIDRPVIAWLMAYAENQLDWPVTYHSCPTIDQAIKLVRSLTETSGDDVRAEFDPKLDLTILELRGSVTTEDLLQAIREYVEPRGSKHLMWIVPPGGLAQITNEDLKELLVGRLDVLERRRGGLTVFVAPEPAEQLLLKWYKSFGDVIVGAPVRVEICSSKAEAFKLVAANLAEDADRG